MTARLLYLVGPPGVGKTSVMAALTARWTAVPLAEPVPHVKYLRTDTSGIVDGLELGRRRGTFSGTDALAMNIGPAARAWIAKRPADLVLAEGQRLATRPFLLAAADAGYQVSMVELTASSATLAARCMRRGSAQNLAWRRGAATRAVRIAEYAELRGWQVVRLSTDDRSPEQLAVILSGRVDLG